MDKSDTEYTEEKAVRRRRSECAWKKDNPLKIDQGTEYPPGPIAIYPSWNPVNRADKPPYSYATIIGHAILTSKERKLTLHDIYVWITENYPFYSNDTQGWQNSIRHNLSLHKSFVKIDRDLSSQNPPRKGCYWTIRPGRERHFIDNLQRPVHSIKRHNSLSQFVSATRRNQVSRRHSSSILYDKANNSGRFNTLRTTTTEIPSATHSETEPNVLSSSSDHLSSRSSSLSGSPNYHELICNVPETSTSYNVYPEHTELFGEQQHMYNQYSSGQSVTYMTESSSHPPSLSPCDAYSTASSYADMTFRSPDYSPRLYSLVHNKNYYKPSLLHGALKFHHDRNIMMGPENTFLQPPYHYHQPEESPNYFIKEEDTNNHHFSPFQR